MRGLPQIHILGLPDPTVKESVLRIKSALRSQGVQLPRGQQIIVDLKPRHLKKRGLGIDLAIAAGIILALEDISLKVSISAYGELDLEGNILAPKNFDEAFDSTEHAIDFMITGPINSASKTILCYKNISELILGLKSLAKHSPSAKPQEIHKRPDRPRANFIKSDLYISPQVALLLKVASLGRHPILVAGPQGTGKSLFSEMLHQLQPPLVESEIKNFRQVRRHFRDLEDQRPMISPHHTSSLIAVVGGGKPIQPGQMTRAHGGIFLMDEFLEFDPRIQEGLREPLEERQVTLSKMGETQTFPADFHFVALTNLCPCGKLSPAGKDNCRCRALKIHQSLGKLSGPLTDRFQILSFSDEWGLDRSISFFQVREELNKIREKTVQPLAPLAEKIGGVLPVQHSFRRTDALIQVAKTLAVLEESPEVTRRHIRKSSELTVGPFERLQSLRASFS